MEHLLLSCIESRVENNRSFYGRFQLGPFDLGQGLTVATALRRTLLSELTGLAITAVAIRGASHEYSTLCGVRESVLDILLNLKQIVFSIVDSELENNSFSKSAIKKNLSESQIGFLKVSGPGIVKARDIKLPTSIQCVDPDQYIATLADNGSLEIRFIICEGKNYIVQTTSPSDISSPLSQQHFSYKSLNLISATDPKILQGLQVSSLNKALSEKNKDDIKDQVLIKEESSNLKSLPLDNLTSDSLLNMQNTIEGTSRPTQVLTSNKVINSKEIDQNIEFNPTKNSIAKEQVDQMSVEYPVGQQIENPEIKIASIHGLTTNNSISKTDRGRGETQM